MGGRELNRVTWKDYWALYRWILHEFKFIDNSI